jgi:hypothetical protein
MDQSSLIAIIAGSVGGALALCALIACAVLLSRRRRGATPADAMASSRDVALEKLRQSYGSAPPGLVGSASEYEVAPPLQSEYEAAPPLRSEYDAPSSRLE